MPRSGRTTCASIGDLTDLPAELVDSAVQGSKVWMEWRLRRRREDGTPMEFAGVNIFEVRGGRFVRGRIYTELVREAGGIEGQIERMTRGRAEAPVLRRAVPREARAASGARRNRPASEEVP